MLSGKLSSVRNFTNDRAINANTEGLKNLAEMGRDDSKNMEQIARETKRDSQTMRVIATMTMLYLPATFVAVSNRPLTAGCWNKLTFPWRWDRPVGARFN